MRPPLCFVFLITAIFALMLAGCGSADPEAAPRAVTHLPDTPVDLHHDVVILDPSLNVTVNGITFNTGDSADIGGTYAGFMPGDFPTNLKHIPDGAGAPAHDFDNVQYLVSFTEEPLVGVPCAVMVLQERITGTSTIKRSQTLWLARSIDDGIYILQKSVTQLPSTTVVDLTLPGVVPYLAIPAQFHVGDHVFDFTEILTPAPDSVPYGEVTAIGVTSPYNVQGCVRIRTSAGGWHADWYVKPGVGLVDWWSFTFDESADGWAAGDYDSVRQGLGGAG